MFAGAGVLSPGLMVTALKTRWCNLDLSEGESGRVLSLPRDQTSLVIRRVLWRCVRHELGEEGPGWRSRGEADGLAHTGFLSSCDGLDVVKVSGARWCVSGEWT